ncbi:MAG TPA: bifunctional phosphoglucose/phosphomannose isomerase [Mycobacteriales bacterium]|nr:bifunctional phosphoglucose/phosphomannose isomerase [Mycobacteriales bacterium]
MTSAEVDEYLLDEPERMAAGDPDGMLPAVAAAPAQFREAVTTAFESGLDEVAADGRPRAVVVTGMGGSGIAGDVLGAVAGQAAPLPILTHRGYGLPAWVGANDLVVAVSCSGRTEETLSACEEAVRRGCRVVTVGAAESPLADLGARGRGPNVPVPGGRLPRASLWALSVPLLVLGDALGVCHVPRADLDATADLLDVLTERYKPAKEAFLNPAKALALAFAEPLPVVWGTSALAGVAAYRAACQLNENAKRAGTWGVLPEANHNQVVPFDDPLAPERYRVLFLRDSDERPEVARRVDAAKELAGERGIGVEEVVAEGDSPIARLASLVACVDFATTYLALLLGLDPSVIAPIVQLKARAAE